MKLQVFILALAMVVWQAHAFFRMECQGRVGLARIDPLVFPGKPAQHLHSIHGSSGISMDASYQDLRDGDCTSCRVKQDKSAYWHPSMFFQDANTGEFELVEQVGGMLAYYQFHLNNLVAFPPGFRMIAGDAMRRNWTTWDPSQPDPEAHRWENEGIDNQESYKERSIGFNCLNYDGQAESTLYRHYLPGQEFINANCPNGVRTEINFPSCWNGKDVDSDDHQSHVAYPDLIRSGVCPDDFPIHLPNLLFETVWNTKDFEDRKGRFVMANGDALGFGYHGDFMSGWDEKFLQQVLETCTHKSGNIDDCALFDIVSEDEARECHMTIPDELKDEDVEGPMSILPGNLGIIWEDHVEYGGEPIPSQLSTSVADLPPNPVESSEAPVIAEPGPEPAPPAESGSEIETQPEDELQSAVDDHGLNVANVQSSFESFSTEADPGTPATTPAPEPELEEGESQSYYSTQTVTEGNVVSIIYWEEEIVFVTEYEDTTTTVTVTAQSSMAKRHIQGHGRGRGRHGRL